jgi:succinate-semialdehyde dehydrogenase/glutarate-semialdehyde dehydrogenase
LTLVGTIIASLPRMTAEDVKEAAEVSAVAFKSWKNTLASERSKILQKMSGLMLEHTDDLAYIMTLESGKPLAEAKGEVNYARSFYDFYAEEATRIKGDVLESSFNGQKMMTIKQPVGPAALITPWNFPCAMITRKIAPALAAGCTVILKVINKPLFR